MRLWHVTLIGPDSRPSMLLWAATAKLAALVARATMPLAHRIATIVPVGGM